MKIVFARLALLEIAHEVQWYERRLRGLGEDLERELDARLERIAQAPSAFRATPEDARARRAPMRRFPFWIIFRETRAAIVVVAFAHKKKRPGYWSRRLRAAP